MMDFREEIEADCSVLMLRALYQKTLVAFGADGLGKYGKCDMPQYYDVEDIAVDVSIDEDDIPIGFVSLKLDGYDATKFGHICSDQNFLISIRKLLIADHIDPACISYSDVEFQGDDFVTFDLDIPLLLDWA